MTQPNGFNHRLDRGETFASTVDAWLSARGVKTADYGQERHFNKDFHDALRQCPEDLTAKYLRYKPDKALVVLINKQAFLAEIKAGNGRAASGAVFDTFTYEVDSYLIAKKLAIIGVRIFVVFGDMSAAWVDALTFREIIIPENRYPLDVFEKMAKQYETQFPQIPVRSKTVSSGSGTVLGKVPRELFRPLERFASEELGIPAIPPSPWKQVATADDVPDIPF